MRYPHAQANGERTREGREGGRDGKTRRARERGRKRQLKGAESVGRCCYNTGGGRKDNIEENLLSTENVP